MKRLLAILLALPLAAHAADPDFTRDIRPLLSDRCFKCHGLAEQKGDLRLDRRDDALAALGLDDPAKSEFLFRITSDDEDEQMPPKGKAKALSADEKAKLRAWVAAGAPYQQHWAYVKPVKAPVPAGANAVDHFVRTKLAEKKVQPSPPASLETLCRRLHLDLIGLPPTPEAVAAFVRECGQDNETIRQGDGEKRDAGEVSLSPHPIVSPSSPQTRKAIAALVESLLASPRFGEKWARHWLDLARYGDSAGYQHDDDMPLWLYRDWVIRALNADMPFDQFTIEQIAGDLLPKATVEQRIATGFHRGSTVTLGADQNVDELRAQLVWDRVNTVGTTWLATSLECAQCHTHKFDPIPHEDYYKMYAYFNRTVSELSKEPGSHYFITGGVLEMPADEARQAKVRRLKAEMEAEIARMVSVKVNLAGASAVPAPLRRIFTGSPTYRTPERTYYYLTAELDGPGPEPIRPHIAKLRQLGRELMDTLPPRALVLEENSAPPITRVFLRGNVRTPGEEVAPGTLSALHPLPKDAPPNRLGLAQWLVSRENPLTARVMVNRWWMELFGNGLVTTPEDFGLQGEFPSHPELLDWLAVEFMERGWSVKHIIKQMVLSATYQQSSALTPEHLQHDPPNRFLARGPRHRLDAELLRDNALAIAGLLRHEVGGKPALATPADADKAKTGFTWRRGIYLRQQRGEPYATFASLDAPDRFACTAKRPRTNTPQQALALLNEPTFITAATALAQRVDQELPGADFTARLTRMFQECTARAPRADEHRALLDLFEKTKREGANEPAAWTLIANVLLNLDETITKE